MISYEAIIAQIEQAVQQAKHAQSEQQMRDLLPEYSSAFDNTAKIAEACNLDFEFGKRKLPFFDVPNGEDHYEYFRRRCYEGLYKKYGSKL